MTSQIKTVEDAFNYTSRDIAVLELFKTLPDQDRAYTEACHKRMVVIEALNQEANGGKKWKPDWENGKWDKYYSWARLKRDKAGVGFVVGDAGYVGTHATTTVGSRLCFMNEDLALYFNEQFADLLQITLAE
jgi:hypothetical protein